MLVSAVQQRVVNNYKLNSSNSNQAVNNKSNQSPSFGEMPDSLATLCGYLHKYGIGIAIAAMLLAVVGLYSGWGQSASP